jgi:hypothetical protein
VGLLGVSWNVLQDACRQNTGAFCKQLLTMPLRSASPSRYVMNPLSVTQIFSNYFQIIFPCIAAEMARLQGDLVAEFHIEKVQPRVNA